MILAEAPHQNRQRLSIQRFGLRVARLQIQQDAEVVEAFGNRLMFIPVDRPPDGGRLAE